MFTDCPGCGRQFHVRAEQLSAAQGWVQCGFCGRQFNALERLHDKPVSRDRLEATAESPIENPEPQFEIPDAEQSGAGNTRSSNDAESRQPPPKPIISRTGAEGHHNTAGNATDIPPELLESNTTAPGWFSRLMWISGVLILFTVGIGQLGWFNRDELLSRYPQLMPWAQQVCEHFQCELIRRHNIAAIELINRDVREHPRFASALLVNATIQNTSSLTQAYPQVQLALFDTNGKMIAHREFEPTEYLDDSIDIKQGMLSLHPVHIVLEVTGQTEGAVSFEFRFL